MRMRIRMKFRVLGFQSVPQPAILTTYSLAASLSAAGGSFLTFYLPLTVASSARSIDHARLEAAVQAYDANPLPQQQ